MRAGGLRATALVAAMLLGVGCGSDGGSPDGTPTSPPPATTSTDAAPTSPAPTSDDGSASAAAEDSPSGTAGTTEDPTAAAVPDDPEAPDTSSTASEHATTGTTALTSEEICARVPAARVAAALGIGSVEPRRSESSTPQCAYAFEGPDGVGSNATIAALHPDGDLGGRRGADAFDHVVTSNRAAVGDRPLDETRLDVGDQAVLMTTDRLHFAVVQFGPRIVTTLVRSRVADRPAATALTEATAPLAPSA